MGLCIEFGPRIQADCDHPMVAGADSCSCPSCGAVCTGKFDGCAGVWERGPTEVMLRARPNPPSRADLNGAAVHRPGSNARSDVVPPIPAGTAPVPDARWAELERLSADVRLLAASVQEAKAYSSGNGAELERLANGLLANIEALPGRMADAIADALAKQHRMIITDVQSALGHFVEQLESARSTKPDASRGPAGGSTTTTDEGASSVGD